MSLTIVFGQKSYPFVAVLYTLKQVIKFIIKYIASMAYAVMSIDSKNYYALCLFSWQLMVTNAKFSARFARHNVILTKTVPIPVCF